MKHERLGHFGNQYSAQPTGDATLLAPITFMVDTNCGMRLQDYLTADEADAVALALAEEARLARAGRVEQVA